MKCKYCGKPMKEETITIAGVEIPISSCAVCDTRGIDKQHLKHLKSDVKAKLEAWAAEQNLPLI